MTNLLYFTVLWFFFLIKFSFAQNNHEFNINNLTLTETQPHLTYPYRSSNNFTDGSPATTLTVTNSSIHTFTNDFCYYFKNVHQINAQTLRIKIIPEGAFIYCKNLTHLALYENDIHFIQPKTFCHNSNLEVLNLFGNKLSEIHSDLFQSNLKLVTLNLGNNRLRAFPVALMTPLPMLQDLLLGFNELTELDVENVTNKFAKLVKISFEFNFISCGRQNMIESYFKKQNIEMEGQCGGLNASRSQEFACIGPNGCIQGSCGCFPDWALVIFIALGMIAISLNAIFIYRFYKK